MTSNAQPFSVVAMGIKAGFKNQYLTDLDDDPYDRIRTRERFWFSVLITRFCFVFQFFWVWYYGCRCWAGRGMFCGVFAAHWQAGQIVFLRMFFKRNKLPHWYSFVGLIVWLCG